MLNYVKIDKKNTENNSASKPIIIDLEDDLTNAAQSNNNPVLEIENKSQTPSSKNMQLVVKELPDEDEEISETPLQKNQTNGSSK